MNENKKFNANDELFEGMLKVALEDAMQRKINELPSFKELNMPQHRVNEFNKRMNKIIKQHDKTRKVKKFLRVFAKAAIIFFAVVAVTGGILMSVEASRNFIRNVIIEMRSDHVVLRFGQTDTSVTMDSGLILRYMPEGFTLVESHRLDALSAFVFTNDVGKEIVVEHIYTTTLSISIDNELRDFSRILLHEHEAFLFDSFYDYALSIIIWEHDGGLITVSTNLPLSELIKIAKNISVK